MADDEALTRVVEAVLAKVGYRAPTEIPDDALLSTEQFAIACSERGVRIAEATLDTMVSRPPTTGEAPVFVKAGRFRRYPWGLNRPFLASRLSKPVRSAAELRVAEIGGPRR
jgi:hypothetical protein